jgi:hypothetical protein
MACTYTSPCQIRHYSEGRGGQRRFHGPLISTTNWEGRYRETRNEEVTKDHGRESKQAKIAD